MEPDASTVHVAASQSAVKAPTGATLGSCAESSARSTTVHIVALAVETADVAVTPGLAPASASASVAIEVMRPRPTPRARLRWVWPSGVVQPVEVLPDLSAQ